MADGDMSELLFMASTVLAGPVCLADLETSPAQELGSEPSEPGFADALSGVVVV